MFAYHNLFSTAAQRSIKLLFVTTLSKFTVGLVNGVGIRERVSSDSIYGFKSMDWNLPPRHLSSHTSTVQQQTQPITVGKDSQLFGDGYITCCLAPVWDITWRDL